MKKRMYGKVLSLLLVLVMVFAVAACGTKNVPTSEVEESTQTSETVQTTETATEVEATVVGEGATKFLFTVVDKEGNETVFEVYTDKETVGEALLELELIAGDEGEYGLFVKKVNGITADYNVDQTYWAFYVDGEYAMSGVDTTAIEEGVSYAMKVEK